MQMLSLVTPTSRLSVKNLFKKAEKKDSQPNAQKQNVSNSNKSNNDGDGSASESDSKTSEEKFDPDKTLYSDNILSDLWIYLSNNNILFGQCLANPKHPFSRSERKLAFIVYACACVTIASFVAHFSHVCTVSQVPPNAMVQNPQVSPNQRRINQNVNVVNNNNNNANNPNAAGVNVNLPPATECEEQITIFGCLSGIVGFYLLRKFFILLSQCSKIDDISSDYNYFVGLICKFMGKQATVAMCILGCIFLVKGSMSFVRNGIPFFLIPGYIIGVLLLSLIAQFMADIFQYFSKRSLEIRFKQLKEKPEDPFKELRDAKAKRNFYIV